LDDVLKEVKHKSLLEDDDVFHDGMSVDDESEN
jgi:hypothetical protein